MNAEFDTILSAEKLDWNAAEAAGLTRWSDEEDDENRPVAIQLRPEYQQRRYDLLNRPAYVQRQDEEVLAREFALALFDDSVARYTTGMTEVVKPADWKSFMYCIQDKTQILHVPYGNSISSLEFHGARMIIVTFEHDAENHYFSSDPEAAGLTAKPAKVATERSRFDDLFN